MTLGIIHDGHLHGVQHCFRQAAGPQQTERSRMLASCMDDLTAATWCLYVQERCRLVRGCQRWIADRAARPQTAMDLPDIGSHWSIDNRTLSPVRVSSAWQTLEKEPEPRRRSSS